MKYEREKLKTLFKRAVTCMAIAYLGITPLVHYDTSARVMTALTGGKVDCGQPAADGQKPVLVDPGGGFDANFNPTRATIDRLRATAIRFNQGAGNKVVIQDGSLPPGMVKDPSVGLLKEYVRIYSGNTKTIHDNQIILDATAVNTAAGMKNLVKMGIDYVEIEDSPNHGNRTTAYGCDDGIKASWISTDKTIDPVDPFKIDYADRTVSFKEGLELAFDAYFPGGGGTTAVKNFSNSVRSLKSNLLKTNVQSSPDLSRFIPIPILAIISFFALRRLNKRSQQINNQKR